MRAVLSSPKARGARCRPIACSSEDERSRRLDHIHAPYHDAIDACLERRMADGRPTALIAIHSFTPVYFGKARPWQVGILFDDDRRLADLLIGGLEGRPSPHRRHQPTLFPGRRGLLHARPPCPTAGPAGSHDRNSQRRDRRRGRPTKLGRPAGRYSFCSNTGTVRI